MAEPVAWRDVLVAAAVVPLFVLTACSDSDQASETTLVETTVARSLPPDMDRTLPEGDEPRVLGPLGETEVEFETEEGLVQIGAADVPDVVAGDFPIPEGIDVQLASQTGDAAGFSGVTDQTFVDLVAFYDVELVAAGYQAAQTQWVDEVVAVYEFEGPRGEGSVAISSAPGGGRSVVVTFTR